MNELEYYTKHLLHSMVNIVENTVFFLLTLAKHLLKQVTALLFLHSVFLFEVQKKILSFYHYWCSRNGVIL